MPKPLKQPHGEEGAPAPVGSEQARFPIVGVGASAGGLEAFTEFLRNLPTTPGIALVLVQHLDPHHASLLSEILARETALTVVQAGDGMAVEQDHVYVIPPNFALTIEDRQLKLRPRESPDGPFMPIDVFFRSLAQDCGKLAAAVVLSGGGTDGALGLQEIKAADGITFVQDERTAKHAAMPHSAEGTGCADFVLAPAQIARELIRLKSQGIFAETGEREQLRDETTALPKIFQLLRQRTGTDFSQYKRPTINRRIARRMALSGVEQLADYVALIQDQPEEQQSLYEDFLIRVTSFFRDAAAFDVLQSTVFPKMLSNRSPDSPIRIWVAGCSTGEEVYSLAISLLEVLGDMGGNTPVKILATDINETALERARAGSYIDNIALDVSADRLRRFFNKTNSHYQICKSVRDLCVFSTHNITRDTPFANLDLISCRNLLIYLDLPLQKRIFPYFHYALKPGGCLMLGTSETIGSAADSFDVIDKECRIYAKKPASTRLPIEFPVSDRTFAPVNNLFSVTAELPPSVDVQKETDRILLNRYAPAAVVVDANLTVQQFRGNTAPYLHPAPGPASLDLLRLAREGLVVELHTAIDAAKRDRSNVRREGIQFQDNGQQRNVSIEVLPIPLTGQEPRAFLIVFDETATVELFPVRRNQRQHRLLKPGRRRTPAY